jgi:hypothetical protein
VCLEEADAKNLDIYKRWAAACKQNGCVAIVQVGTPLHASRPSGTELTTRAAYDGAE